MATYRHVRRLRVQASRPEDARRGAVLIEDGLRTASIPGAESGKLLVIRRLSLGRIDRHDGPVAVSLQIETAVHKAAAGAVSFDAATAAADVVTFSSQASAIISLAHRHARHESADAWFWPEIVPGWNFGAGRSRNWRCLVEAAVDLPEASIVQGAIVHEALEAGAAEELISALSPRLANAYLAASGWRNVATTDPGHDSGRRISKVPGGRSIELPGDDRAVWLLTMLAVHHQPSRAADARLPKTMRRSLERDALLIDGRASDGRHAARTGMRQDGTDAAVPYASTAALDEGKERMRSGQDAKPRETMPDARTDERKSKSLNNDGPPHRRSSVERENAAASDRPDGNIDATSHEDVPAAWTRAPTTAGGLLFLVPVLEQLGMAAWAEQHPELLETGFPPRLLQYIGEEVRVDLEDPILKALSDLYDAAPPPPIMAPPASVRTWAAPFAERIPRNSLFGAWHAAARAWCRHHARISLRALVRRSGVVMSSPTHLWITFRLTQLDTCVRRLALDVDPGWVPWMGRVIQYHYRETDDRDG